MSGLRSLTEFLNMQIHVAHFPFRKATQLAYFCLSYTSHFTLYDSFFSPDIRIVE